MLRKSVSHGWCLNSVCIAKGEPRSKKVENGSDFLKKLPRKEVEVLGLAFSVVVIGRNELKRLAKMNET